MGGHGSCLLLLLLLLRLVAIEVVARDCARCPFIFDVHHHWAAQSVVNAVLLEDLYTRDNQDSVLVSHCYTTSVNITYLFPLTLLAW